MSVRTDLLKPVNCQSRMLCFENIFGRFSSFSEMEKSAKSGSVFRGEKQKKHWKSKFYFSFHLAVVYSFYPLVFYLYMKAKSFERKVEYFEQWKGEAESQMKVEKQKSRSLIFHGEERHWKAKKLMNRKKQKLDYARWEAKLKSEKVNESLYIADYIYVSSALLYLITRLRWEKGDT